MAKVSDSQHSWLTKSFLTKAIQSYKKDHSVEVLNFTINDGFSEHFCSSMVQCKIEFSSSKTESETLSVVIKMLPTGADKSVIEVEPYFKTEIKMYKDVIPALTELLKRSGIEVELGPE